MYLPVKNIEYNLQEKPEKSPKSKRRFDTVRNLLEKACQKLLNTKHNWNSQSGDSKANQHPKEKVK